MVTGRASATISIIDQCVRVRFAGLFFLRVFLSCISSAYAQNSTLSDTLQLSKIEIFAKKLQIPPIEIVELKDYSAIPIRNIGEFLENEPNVSGIRKGGTAVDPVIRGFRFSQVTTILDNGINLEGGCPNRMDPVTSHVEPEEVKTIELVKGPFVLKYGPVM